MNLSVSPKTSLLRLSYGAQTVSCQFLGLSFTRGSAVFVKKTALAESCKLKCIQMIDTWLSLALSCKLKCIQMIDTWLSLALSVCRVFHSRAYESDHLAVFHSQYINDMVQSRNRSKVILGQYFLPPQDIVDCECQRHLDNTCPFFLFSPLFFCSSFFLLLILLLLIMYSTIEFVILGEANLEGYSSCSSNTTHSHQGV